MSLSSTSAQKRAVMIALPKGFPWKAKESRSSKAIARSTCGTFQFAAVRRNGHRPIPPIRAWRSTSGCSNLHCGTSCRAA